MLIKVIEGADAGKYLEVKRGEYVLIGRDKASCAFRISDPRASRQHASVSVDNEGRVVLADNNSQNGTYYRGKAIAAPVFLHSGDIFTIGSTRFEITLASAPYTSPGIGREEPEAAFTANNPRLDSTYLHAGSTISVGRDSGNDLVLDHPHVSRRHAQIEMTASGTFIQDLHSTNGTYVDGVKITGRQLLGPDSVIRISGYRLTLADFQLIKQDETAGQVEIEVRDLSKVVKKSDGEEIVLLNNLNFRVEPREFVAILGGSGTGKTTLLKALMGISPATFGEMLINGTNYYQEYGAFKSLIGYVPQDDIVHLELTVEEVLRYAARLRMPDDTNPEERELRVEEVMNALDLSHRRTTVVKNLSGGQRKRVSIGVELITKPSILFLDEPTSGLDPGLEKIMMQMMRKTANEGQTIFLVTHATFNIHLCDKVIFLTEGGRLAFFGSPREALEYFGTDDFAEIYRMINMDRTPEEWQQSYSLSELAFKYQPRGEAAESSGITDSGAARVSVLKQWFDLTERYARINLRDRRNLMVLILQPIIIALVISIIFLSNAPLFVESNFLQEDLVISEIVMAEGRVEEVTENSKEEQQRQRNMNVLVLALVVSAVWTGTSNSFREIIKEISIYKRERFVNLRIAPYLFSKVFVIGLIGLVQSFFFIAIYTLLLGLPHFGKNFLAFFLVGLASAMMGLAISAIASNSNVATTVLPIMLIPQLIMSGALIPISDVEPEVIRPFFNIIIAKWGYELIGGEIVDLNSLVAFDEPYKALIGPFSNHWWFLLLIGAILYLIVSVAMLRKDKDLS